MATVHEVERKALEQAAVLVHFAAENRQLSENIVATIANSWEAAQDNKWTPEISSKFWAAFNALCVVVRPATLDSIQVTNESTPGPTRLAFWRESRSRPKAAARGYLVALVVFLIVSIFLQFAVSNAASLAAEVDKMIAEMDKTVARMTQAFTPLRGAIGSREFTDVKVTPEQAKVINEVQNDLRQIWLTEDRIAAKLKLFQLLTLLDRPAWHYGSLDTVKSVAEFDFELTKYYAAVREFRASQESGLLVIKVLSSTVLPLLLGMVGAGAYITRLISEQIRDSTFSSTSSVRHLVRFALGALAGVVVGLGWLNTDGSTSSLALAFVAGYAVEPVFATVDNIAEKFRRN